MKLAIVYTGTTNELIEMVEGGEYLFRSHDYRHTVATFFYDNGASLQSVRDYLGHNYEEMTEQYLDYGPRRIARANDEFFEEPGNRLAAHLEKKGGRNGRQVLLSGTGML